MPLPDVVMKTRSGAIYIAVGVVDFVVMSTVCPVNQVKIGHFCGRLSVFFITY